jgi:hypothetical protein
LITFTAILPPSGRSNGRLTVEYSDSHAASSMSARSFWSKPSMPLKSEKSDSSGSGSPAPAVSRRFSTSA